MNLTPYVESLRRELEAAGDNGGDAAIRLTFLELLSAASDEITRELAPGSAEVRLRGGEPDFVIALPPADEPAEASPAPPLIEGDDSAMTRINLRLPEPLKAGIEQAAARERLSVNAWLVRAAGAALDGPPARPRGGHVGQSFTGWVQ